MNTNDITNDSTATDGDEPILVAAPTMVPSWTYEVSAGATGDARLDGVTFTLVTSEIVPDPEPDLGPGHHVLIKATVAVDDGDRIKFMSAWFAPTDVVQFISKPAEV